jgi:hypothetical protein
MVEQPKFRLTIIDNLSLDLKHQFNDIKLYYLFMTLLAIFEL